MKLLERFEQQQCGLEYELVDATPEMARYWMTLNTSNRRLNTLSVNRLASDILEDRWRQNGESIKFDRENRLIDGQHRLAAIIKANRTVRLLVVRNLDPLSQHTVDVGVSRTAGQIAGMLGVGNPNDVTSLAHALMRYDHARDAIWSASNSPTKPQIVEYVLANQSDLEHAILLASQARRAIRMRSVPYGLLAFHALRQHTKDVWTQWHERIIDGVGLGQTDPRLILRNQVMRRESKHGAWSQQEMTGWVIKAWNAWYTGREIKLLRFTRDELPMPAIA